MGIWLENYNQGQLVKTPRVYLIPAGRDVLRPRGSNGQLRYWNVQEAQIPVPYPVGEADLTNASWIPSIDGLSGDLFSVKPFAKMRAFPLTNSEVNQIQSFPMNTTQRPSPLALDTRLVGRSVWNTQWLLVIPGSTLLDDPNEGLERFIKDVKDIHLYIETYSYAGIE